MRRPLFSAILPPPEVTAAVREELARLADPGGLRWSPPADWHVTLGFYGPDDPARRSAWLRKRLAARPAPRLRIDGAGTFPGVLWLGVDGAGLTDLADAVRADPGDHAYRGHLTLARLPRDADPAPAENLSQALAGFRSLEWTSGEVVLMRTAPPGESPDRVRGRYAVVDRFDLGPGSP